MSDVTIYISKIVTSVKYTSSVKTCWYYFYIIFCRLTSRFVYKWNSNKRLYVIVKLLVGIFFKKRII